MVSTRFSSKKVAQCSDLNDLRSQPDWLCFWQRSLPSSNCILIRTADPILIDPGIGSDWAETLRFLVDAGVPPEKLRWLVLTHRHADHAGNAARLQRDYGVRIAAHRGEKLATEFRNSDPGDWSWLDHPAEPLRVDRWLYDGEVNRSGDLSFQIVHVPGHSPEQIALFEEASRILLCGDAVHHADLG